MAYNHGREDRKWRIWKEAEEKLLRECGVDEATIEQIRMADKNGIQPADGRTGNGVSGKKRRKSCCVSAALMKRPLSRYAWRTGQTSIPRS